MKSFSPVELLAEKKRREAQASTRPVFLDPQFPSQSAFIEDKSRLKAGLCTARAGKSYGAALYLLKTAYETPGASCLYLALTRDSAKRIMWKDAFQVIDRTLKLGLTFNKSELSITCPNGAVIYLMGADASEAEREKILGQKFKLVIVDEAASFTTDLKDLVYRILKPRVSDYQGTICLIGTPGNLTRGLFFDITNGNEKGWSIHKWSALDNPYQAKQHQAELQEIEANRPLFKETPAFKQMYLGEWSVETDKLVYRFNPERNLYRDIRQAQYNLILGVDLGFEDDSSFVLMAYGQHDSTAYVLESRKQPGLTITGVAKVIKDFQSRFEIDQVVVDGANKQAVEEMRAHHGLASLKAADKSDKFSFIDLLNADLIEAKLKIHEACTDLIKELQELIVDERSLQRTGKRAEHPACANHLCDAMLYAWRHCYAYLATPEAVKPKLGTPEWFKAEEEAMERAQLERHRPKQDWEVPMEDFPGMTEPFPEF